MQGLSEKGKKEAAEGRNESGKGLADQERINYNKNQYLGQTLVWQDSYWFKMSSREDTIEDFIKVFKSFACSIN